MKDKPEKKTSPAAELGRLGGRAVAKKRGKKYMRDLGRKGAASRWEKARKNSEA